MTTELNRRTFLTLAATFGASGAAFFAMRNAALAQSAGTLTWARPEETVLYDVHAASLSSSWHIHQMIYDSLVTLDDALNIVPSLATAWEWQGTTLVFTLREDVKFANGRAMTQADVVGSIQRALTTPGNPWGLMLRNLKETKAEGTNQVAMVFDGPNNVALAAMTASLVAILPMEEFAAKTFDPTGEMMMGTGPYVVKSHVANDNWTLEANPHYWGGAPKVGTVVVKTIPSAQGIVAALTDGSAQLASFGGNPDAPALLAGVANVTVVAQAQTAFSFLALNAVTEGSPFIDLRVRQAVALALDRAQIVDFAYAGTATPSYGYTQFKIGDDTALPLYARDLDKAKALIAEAAPARMQVNMIYGSNGELDGNIAQVVKSQLAEIGFDVQLEGLEEGVWLSRTWTGEPSQFDLNVTWFSGFAHPLVTAHWWAPELAGFTAGHVAADADYTAALNEALFAADEPTYQAAIAKLYARMNELANLIPIASRGETVAYRADMVMPTISALQNQEDIMQGIETYEIKA